MFEKGESKTLKNALLQEFDGPSNEGAVKSEERAQGSAYEPICTNEQISTPVHI